MSYQTDRSRRGWKRPIIILDSDSDSDEENILVIDEEEEEEVLPPQAKRIKIDKQTSEIASSEYDGGVKIEPYDFQRNHIDKIKKIFTRNYVALDTSETGCGKTITTLKIAAEQGKDLFIVCPMSAMSSWYRIIEALDLMGKVLTVVNYDRLRNGKWFDVRSYIRKKNINYNDKSGFWSKIKSTVCPYLKKTTTNDNSVKRIEYDWNLPPNVLLVLDEAHKSKNRNTQNSKLMVEARDHIYRSGDISDCSRKNCSCPYAKFPSNKSSLLGGRYVQGDIDIIAQQASGRNYTSGKYLKYFSIKLGIGDKCINDRDSGKRMILLTATPIEKEVNVGLVAYMLGYIPQPTTDVFRQWMHNKTMRDVHGLFYKSDDFRACRMVMNEAKKETAYEHICDIKAKVIEMTDDKREAIQASNRKIREALDALKSRRQIDGNHPFVAITRSRQEIESLKMDDYIAIVRKKLEKKYHVVVFLNFLDNIAIMEEAFKDIDYGKIVGGQNHYERKLAEDNFQSNTTQLLLCTIAAGNASISMHDMIGGGKRYTLVSMPWSASDLRQVGGRTNRIGSKSDPTIRIPFCAGTIEEHMALVMNQKLQNMDIFNSGGCEQTLMDMLGTDIEKMDMESKKAKYYTRKL